MNWKEFKEKKFAVRCEESKDEFFAECKKNGIVVLMGDREKLRTLYVCVRRYEDRFSPGRFELYSLDPWHIKPGMMYGKDGLPVVDWLDKTPGAGV